ncbi:YhhN-like protein [Coemansia reversa NRRL 1564]|uniref:YhhN-like protein n=1 Tax=Coemansia reversa (strain ATCC 12441 / NRRL 1564) TaxID=763665 RepID=A0A2G5B9X8_COERN|nr:YhhN-like protein [Coemansia reversa NRRL 1564]|eukprot:PIA15814.1 YhhN-like protein [Coemansia reversa NRRL 1564]
MAMTLTLQTIHVISATLVCLYLVAIVGNWYAIKYALKPVITLLIAYPTFRKPFPYISLGLVFSAIGDALLMIPHEDAFVFGLLSFLVAHILYIMSFKAPVRLSWAAIPLTVFSGTMLYMLQPGITKENVAVQLGVIIYVVAITTMTYRALFTGNTILTIGALLFCVSDAVLAWEKYVYPYTWCEFVIMLTYYIAQLCIAVVHC